MKRNEAGQGLVEYVLILVLVAIVVIAVLSLLGPRLDIVVCPITSPFNSFEVSTGCVLAHDDNVTTSRNTAVVIDVAMNDGYIGGSFCSPGEPCPVSRLSPSSVSVLSGSGPTNGTLVNHGDGTITYTPNNGFTGIDGFQYRISNEDFSSQDFARVRIGVGVVVQANDDMACTSENTVLRIENFYNDFAVPGIAAPVVFTDPPDHGTVVVRDCCGGDFGQIYTRFTPETDYVGSDEFEYQICTPGGDCDTATVFVDILDSACPLTSSSAPSNGQPQNQNSQPIVPEGTARNLLKEKVLALYEEVERQDAAFLTAGAQFSETAGIMIDVLQAPPEVEADFKSGDPDLIIDAMQVLYSLYIQAPTESKYDIIAGSRNQFLNGCAALEGAEVSLELVDDVIDVTQAVEELYPGSTLDAITDMEMLREQVVLRNEIVASSADVCSVIIDFLLGFDDLNQVIANAQIGEEGIRQSLLAKADQAEDSFNFGNLTASGNQLCALVNEVNAQEGQHIDPASADDIRDMVLAMAGQLGIPLNCSG